MQPQRAIFRLVVDEESLPGQQPLVFKTLDRLARPKRILPGRMFISWSFESLIEGQVLADEQEQANPRLFTSCARGAAPGLRFLDAM